jgi:LAO/AO transport system kinase
LGTIEDLTARFLGGDRTALSRIITIVENREDGYGDILDRVFPGTGKAYRIGVTGPPGAGKSTLVSGLVQVLRRSVGGGAAGEGADRAAPGATEGRGAARAEGGALVRVGVIAVDPTSPFTGGALLGDRIRMQDIGCDPGVFVRSMATRGSLGGLAEAAGDVADVMDAFGFDYVITETVGVGQCELDIAQACYTTIVVIVPESGDSVQAMKAGLMEIADVIVINKSDRDGADRIATETRSMLDLRRPHAYPVSGGRSGPAEAGREDAGWQAPVLQTIASRGDGMACLRDAIDAHRKYLTSSGLLERHRRSNVEGTIRGAVELEIRRRVWSPEGTEKLACLVEEVIQGRKTPRQASREILSWVKCT